MLQVLFPNMLDEKTMACARTEEYMRTYYMNIGWDSHERESIILFKACSEIPGPRARISARHVSCCIKKNLSSINCNM